MEYLDANSGTLTLRLALNPIKRLIFLHLNDFNGLALNDTVEAGQIIGHVGVKGFATGPHVHVELVSNRTRPACYFTNDSDAINHHDPTTFNK